MTPSAGDGPSPGRQDFSVPPNNRGHQARRPPIPPRNSSLRATTTASLQGTANTSHQSATSRQAARTTSPQANTNTRPTTPPDGHPRPDSPTIPDLLHAIPPGYLLSTGPGPEYEVRPLSPREWFPLTDPAPEDEIQTTPPRPLRRTTRVYLPEDSDVANTRRRLPLHTRRPVSAPSNGRPETRTGQAPARGGPGRVARGSQAVPLPTGGRHEAAVRDG